MMAAVFPLEFLPVWDQQEAVTRAAEENRSFFLRCPDVPLLPDSANFGAAVRKKK